MKFKISRASCAFGPPCKAATPDLPGEEHTSWSVEVSTLEDLRAIAHETCESLVVSFVGTKRGWGSVDADSEITVYDGYLE